MTAPGFGLVFFLDEPKRLLSMYEKKIRAVDDSHQGFDVRSAYSGTYILENMYYSTPGATSFDPGRTSACDQL